MKLFHILNKDKRLYKDIINTISLYYTKDNLWLLYKIFVNENLTEYFEVINLLLKKLTENYIIVGDSNLHIKNKIKNFEWEDNLLENHQSVFIKDIMLPYLFEKKNILSTTIYKHPFFIIKFDNYEYTIKNNLTLKSLLKSYTKIYIISRTYSHEEFGITIFYRIGKNINLDLSKYFPNIPPIIDSENNFYIDLYYD